MAYEVKIDGDWILIKEKLQPEEQQLGVKKELPLYEPNLFQKIKAEGTDIMSFKFSNQGKNSDSGKSSFNYTAGQYAYFDIGGVKNDPKGPIRHLTIASSPTENFIMISTRIRDTLKQLASLEEGTVVKVRGPEGKFVLHDDCSKTAVRRIRTTSGPSPTTRAKSKKLASSRANIKSRSKKSKSLKSTKVRRNRKSRWHDRRNKIQKAS
ncbi:MAG: hypothetical protein WBL67_19745 [Nitrososphaeraceae archaeon]